MHLFKLIMGGEFAISLSTLNVRNYSILTQVTTKILSIYEPVVNSP